MSRPWRGLFSVDSKCCSLPGLRHRMLHSLETHHSELISIYPLALCPPPAQHRLCCCQDRCRRPKASSWRRTWHRGLAGYPLVDSMTEHALAAKWGLCFQSQNYNKNYLKRPTEQMSLPCHNLCFPVDSLQGDEKVKFCDSTFTCLSPSLFLTRCLCWPCSTLSLKPDSGLTTLQKPFSWPLPPASLNTRQHALGTCTFRRHRRCDFACADALIWKRTLYFCVSGGREGIGKSSP